MNFGRMILFLSIAVRLHAQVFDASQAGVPVQIPADAGWRFHDEAPGENGVEKGWAAAGFDDSAWATGDGRVPADTVVRWYRLKVRLPRQRPAAIYVDGLGTAIKVYADGQWVGGTGGSWSVARRRAWSGTLPRQVDSVEIALRASLTATKPNAVLQKADIGRSPVQNGYIVIGGVKFLLAGGIGMALLLLWFRKPEFRANLWLSISLLTYAFLYGSGALLISDLWPVSLGAVFVVIPPRQFYTLAMIPEIEFVFAWFGRPVDRWVRVVQIGFVGIAVLGRMAPPWVGLLPLFSTAAIWLGLVIVLGARGNSEAWILTPPSLLRFALRFLAVSGWLTDIHAGAVAFDLDDIAMLLYFVSISFVVLRRFLLVTQESDRIAGELAAAQEAQSRLVPAAPADPPGYRLEVAYLAAAEVGGDYYQVFPLSDGRCALVIGDVSGKGLKAAMTGMLLMGALRTVEMESAGPAAMLAAMNRALCSAKGASGGTEFATCLCLVLDRSGGCVLANAGHLGPYSNGAEIAGPSDLPLGISGDVEYEERSFRLAAGAVLTMFTDGVLEATNARGEMLGFERLRELAGKAAGEIAEAAKAWGQNDDITVVKVACAC